MSNQGYVISEAGPETRPIREIIGDILQDVSRIIQAEIRLARTELTEKAKAAGKASWVLGGAAMAGILAGACFVTTCIAALALVMPVWLGALFMGILLSFGAAGAYAMGRSMLLNIEPAPQQTMQTLKDDVKWAKQRTE